MRLTPRRAWRALRRYPISSLVGGLWLSRHFRGGFVLWQGGFPFPKVQNAGGTLHADGVTLFSGVRLEVGRGAQLSIGKGTFLNRNTTVVCEREVTIGRDCMISWDVVILDTDQHEWPGIGKGTAPVRIGDGVWICCRSVILKGVTIGDGAVIGAGAIVTRDVPAHTLALGQPARLVRRLDTGETIHATNGHGPTFDSGHGWPASVLEHKS